jgi:tetratricopeptide (TPR) repeat protein
MTSQSGFQDPLKERTWVTMLSYAFFRLESALTIALILLLTFFLPYPFAWWKWWYWLALGLVAEALIIYTSITDPETGQQLVADMLREQYDPGSLRQAKYRKQLEKALDYHRRMAELIGQLDAGVLKDRLMSTVNGIDAWIANMYHLSRRLDDYEADKVIARDMETVPQALETLKKRLDGERDPAVRAQMEETLASKEAQWQNLQKLRGMMGKADLQLEKTLSDLGNVYSQLRQIEARDVDRGRAQRIAEDNSDQVATLQDIVDSMDEVYSAREVNPTTK